MKFDREKTRKDIVIENTIFFAVPVLFILLWQVAGNLNLINGIIIPTPYKILEAFISLLTTGKWWNDFSASIRRVLLGFFYGTTAGIVIGVLSGLFSKFNKAIDGIFSILRPIPMIGLVPLMILWFGIGETSKVIVISVGTFWSVLLNTQAGLASTDRKLLEVAQILEKDNFTILRKIVFPSALPQIFTGVRIGVGNAWKSVVAAEMLAATKGIGHLIEYARELAQPAKMFVGILTIGIVGLLIDFLIRKLQKILIRWG